MTPWFSKYYILFYIGITVLFFFIPAATTAAGRLGRLQGLFERRNETGCSTAKLDLNTQTLKAKITVSARS